METLSFYKIQLRDKKDFWECFQNFSWKRLKRKVANHNLKKYNLKKYNLKKYNLKKYNLKKYN